MTIWQIILYWMISELIAWGVWYTITYRTLRAKTKDANILLLMTNEMGAYPRTQNKVLEWIRFIVWPYGIAQRMIVVHKIYKKWTSD